MSTSAPPKYLQIAHAIELQIKAGAWKAGRLPSLRGLAQEYRVSVITMSRAVQVLRDSGLIGRTDHSGCYLAASGPVPSFGLCLRITPGTWQRQSGAILLQGFQAVEAAGEARFLEPFRLDGDVGVQVRGVVGVAHGVILQPARKSDEWAAQDERFLAACAAQRLPVVLLERHLRGRYREQTHDLVAVDDFHGGVCCTRHLLNAGRKRVALVIASPTSSHEGREAGYLHALRNARPGERFEPIVLCPPGAPGKESDRWLADQVLAAGADAVFCYQDAVAVGLIVELLSRGVSVPRQVAVCGFEDLPIGDLFTIGVTTYRYPSAELVRTCLEMLKWRSTRPDAPPRTALLRGELVVRESTGG